jgi:hypothetical protein
MRSSPKAKTKLRTRRGARQQGQIPPFVVPLWWWRARRMAAGCIELERRGHAVHSADGAPGEHLLALRHEWAPEEEARTTLRLIPGGALTQTDDADRWMNEGGSLASEVTPPLPATAARR